MALGRISGPLLKSNLLREGVNLAFETNLLYLDVTNKRIGINTDTPTADLQVNGTIRSTTSRTGYLEVDQVNINDNVINTSLGDLRLGAATGLDIVSTTNFLPDVTDTYNIGSELKRWNIGRFKEIFLETSTSNSIITNDLTVNGDTKLGNADTDSIDVTAEFISNLVPNVTNTYDLGTVSKFWQNVYGSVLYNGDIRISNNLISTTLDNSNLELDTDGIGTIELKSDTNIIGELSVTQDVTLDSNITINGGNLTTSAVEFNLVNTTATTVNFAGAATTIQIGTNSGTTTIKNNLQVDYRLGVGGDLLADGNIRLGNQGTDTIDIPSTFISNLVPNVTSLYNLGSTSKTWLNLYTDNARINGVKIDTNVISAVNADTDLIIRTSGTGTVYIDSTQALRIPVGTDANRPAGITGQVRFNTTNTQFEGFNGSAWSSLGGVRDVDGNTYIIPEATTGANDNTLWFYNDGVLSATLTKTELTLNQETVSTSTTTGALVVAGGAGIGENLYVGGNVTTTGKFVGEIYGGTY